MAGPRGEQIRGPYRPSEYQTPHPNQIPAIPAIIIIIRTMIITITITIPILCYHQNQDQPHTVATKHQCDSMKIHRDQLVVYMGMLQIHAMGFIWRSYTPKWLEFRFVSHATATPLNHVVCPYLLSIVTYLIDQVANLRRELERGGVLVVGDVQ